MGIVRGGDRRPGCHVPADRHEYGYRPADEFCGLFGKPIVMAVGPAILNSNVLPLDGALLG